MYTTLGGCSLFFFFPNPNPLKPPSTSVSGASRKLMYFRTMFVVVSVYNSTGHFQPDLPAMSEDSQWRAPWKREMWLGCEDIPRASKVTRVSIVAVGSSEALVDFLEDEFEGENADERIRETSAAAQVFVILSGNFESSMTRTSEADRRPRIVAEAASSSLRISPRPSASPIKRAY